MGAMGLESLTRALLGSLKFEKKVKKTNNLCPSFLLLISNF